MKHTIQIEQEVEVTHLKVSAGVRYWEDATINGIRDEEGTLTPLRHGDNWCPTIELETGKIQNWPEGTTADLHFKVCDAGIYELLDADGKVVASRDGYVPRMMCPEENGYGDYIIMKIGPDGIIEKWEVDFDFLDED